MRRGGAERRKGKWRSVEKDEANFSVSLEPPLEERWRNFWFRGGHIISTLEPCVGRPSPTLAALHPPPDPMLVFPTLGQRCSLSAGISGGKEREKDHAENALSPHKRGPLRWLAKCWVICSARMFVITPGGFIIWRVGEPSDRKMYPAADSLQSEICKWLQCSSWLGIKFALKKLHLIKSGIKREKEKAELKGWKIKESKYKTCNEFPKSLTFPSLLFDAYLEKFIAVFTSF